MSSKLIVVCLAFVAVSAWPVDNNGYTYTEGVSGNLDTSASVGVNYVQPVGVVKTVQTKFVQQPQVTTTVVRPQFIQSSGSQYVQPGSQFVQTSGSQYPSGSQYVQSQYVQTSGSQFAQPQVNIAQTASGSQYVQPQVNIAQTPSGSQYVQASSGESPSVLISASSVGVPYVKSSENNYVEQNYNQEIQYSQPIISKNFYTFSGPEERDERTAVHHITVGKPQKNYKVIFIKNPSSSVNKALIKAHIAPTEEKTVVYVLSKHQNELNIESEVDEVAPTQPSKPEVVFVKYRTPEEIAHLQETVQTQYNVLGGANHVSDEGFAPVRSVIGSLGGAASEIVENHSGVVGVEGPSYTSGGVGVGGGSTSFTAGGVGGGSSNYQTEGGSTTFTAGGSIGSGSASHGLVSGNLVGGSSYYENGAAASSPQYTTTTTQQKVYLPPTISARSDTLSEEEQAREISRIIKSTAKLHAIGSVSSHKTETEEGVTPANEDEE